MIRICLGFLLLPLSTFCQQFVEPRFLQGFSEIGIQAGVAGYAGDFGGAAISFFKPGFGINSTYRVSPFFSLRPAFTLAKIAGDDNKSGNDVLATRNLNFKSNIAELSILADVNPFTILPSYVEADQKFIPYVSVGLGVFHFNPKSELNGKYYELKPLRLEGQGFSEYPTHKTYSKLQFNFAFGGGFKYYISDNKYLGVESIIRKTFTDYLDDVSTTYIDPALFDKYLSSQDAALAKQLYNRQNTTVTPGLPRGSPKSKDYYYTIAIRYGIVLRSKVF